jgi:hypothetical protein
MMYGVGLILVAMAGGLEWLIVASKHTLSASLLGIFQKPVHIFYRVSCSTTLRRNSTSLVAGLVEYAAIQSEPLWEPHHTPS